MEESAGMANKSGRDTTRLERDQGGKIVSAKSYFYVIPFMAFASSAIRIA